MPMTREFLGWDEPFLGKIVSWLWARRADLTGILLAVPTAQSGRRLRSALVERAAAEGARGLLTPRVVTTSFFLEVDADAADQVRERLVWLDVLENISDWRPYEAAFPVPPGEDESPGWALGLAESLCNLRRELSEGGMTIAMAATRMKESLESGRWAALAALENLLEKRLREWGFQSLARAQVNGIFAMPQACREVVVAGVGDAGANLRSRWQKLAGQGVPVTFLMAAPENLASHFDDFGRPEVAFWEEETLPAQRVYLERNGREQARRALRLVADSGVASDGLVLGSADQEVGTELVDVFGAAGWKFHDSANAGRRPRLASWLQVWRRFLADPRLASVADLLELAETGILVKGRRAQKARLLSDLRARWLLDGTEDLERALAGKWRGTEKADELLQACRALEKWRADFLRRDFSETMARLLRVFGGLHDERGELGEEVTVLRALLSSLAPLLKRLDYGAAFWLEVLAGTLAERREAGPEDRVGDVQGWLELLFEPGEKMVLCGMNEGLVPSRGVQDAWLVEATREHLGLPTEDERAARDAFLLRAMLEARRQNGQVDLICGKVRANGDVLQPSRLLLAVPPENLATRVKLLFAEIEPPEAGMAWERDWQWQVPPDADLPGRLNITAIKNYLHCPFRFYLSYVRGMYQVERGMVEWDSRQFGIVLHDVLEQWGNDATARDFSKTEAIEDWVLRKLDQVVDGHFGKNWPLAVEIQVTSMRQRLRWFAREQACARAQGWEVTEVEKKVEYEIDGLVLVGKVDRIDRHKDGTWRVIDYKTGRVKDGVERLHWKNKGRAHAPAHLEDDERLYWEDAKIWVDLQLPLYAAILERQETVTGETELAYFALGESEAAVKMEFWPNYEKSIGDSALSCAEMVVERIKARDFWPPAEKGGPYDNFSELILQGTLEDAVAWQG